jgi:hypothetical protein
MATAQPPATTNKACLVTAEERARIQEAARRYVREAAPTPPTAILEQVVRIVLEARTSSRSTSNPARTQHQDVGGPDQPEAA